MKNYLLKKIISVLFFVMLAFVLEFSFNNVVMSQLSGGPNGVPGCKNNCPPGNIKIIKNTVGGDKDAWFNFTLKRTGPPDEPGTPPQPTKKLAVISSTPNPAAPKYKGTGAISVKPGKYEISELARDADDWTFTGASCSPAGILTADGVDNVSVSSGGTTTCTFNNNGQGILKIVTNAIGDNEISLSKPKNFEYTIKRYDPESPSQTVNSVTVNTNRLIRKDAIRGDEWTGEKKIDADKGITVYSITQKIDQTGWALDSVVCEVQYKDSATPTGIRTQYAYGVINVTVRGGRTTTCTFKNTMKGQLKIVESTQGASGTSKFNFDVNFVSTEYFPPNILPFAIDSNQCGYQIGTGQGQTCSVDEDCNICKEDCEACSSPRPQNPGPGYSPSRMTVGIGGNQTKRIYPGVYRVLDHLPELSSGNQRWSFDSVQCTLENNEPTGQRTVSGIDKLEIYAGKTTTCTFKHSLINASVAPSGVGGAESDDPPKPTLQPVP